MSTRLLSVTFGCAIVLLLAGCSSPSRTALSPPPCAAASAAPARPPRLPATTSSVAVPGHPFGIVATPDHAHAFVALDADPADPSSHSAVGLLRRTGLRLRLVQTFPVAQFPAGMALTHEGDRLLVATGAGLTVLDVARALRGDPTAVVAQVTGGGSGNLDAAVTADDAFAFVSAETSSLVGVYELATSKNSQPTVVGSVPTDPVPVGEAFSRDGRYLFVTTGPRGLIDVIDVARAEHDPAHAVVRRSPAGCSPVRAVLAASGVLWVSARGSNAVLAFDSRKLIAGARDALLASVPVGPAPVGLLLVDHGRYLLVANSNRFSDPGHDQYVSVVDTQAALAHRNAVVGSIAAGRFPREIASLDESHVLVGNYLSEAVEIIATEKLAAGR